MSPAECHQNARPIASRTMETFELGRRFYLAYSDLRFRQNAVKTPANRKSDRAGSNLRLNLKVSAVLDLWIQTQVLHGLVRFATCGCFDGILLETQSTPDSILAQG